MSIVVALSVQSTYSLFMKTTTKEILMTVWNRGSQRAQDVAGILGHCVERRETWEEVVARWGPLPQYAEPAYREALRAEWG